MTGSLYDSISIGTTILPNRLVRSATWEGMCDPAGTPSEKLFDYYRTLARGGVGLIISGYTFVRTDGKQLPGKMGIDTDALVPSLRKLTDAVHAEGGKVFCQLVHAGGQTSSKATGSTPLAPSSTPFPSYPELPREMAPEDIRDIVAAFASGARRAREAGFDGVQLHGAHGYLINQFLSPLTNQRTDTYGGALENRMRFLLEVLRAVRGATGEDYPVVIKLTASDNLAGGFSIDEGIAVARRLEEEGIDAIEVSSGTPASGDEGPVRTKIDTEEKEGYNADFAGRIRQHVKVPVMVVGGLRSCSVMRRLLDTGGADLFALSRPLIREANLPRRWRDDPSHRATCTSCNGCFKPGLKEGGIYCVLDERPQKNP